jgi:hypothetical protein
MILTGSSTALQRWNGSIGGIGRLLVGLGETGGFIVIDGLTIRRKVSIIPKADIWSMREREASSYGRTFLKASNRRAIPAACTKSPVCPDCLTKHLCRK